MIVDAGEQNMLARSNAAFQGIPAGGSTCHPNRFSTHLALGAYQMHPVVKRLGNGASASAQALGGPHASTPVEEDPTLQVKDLLFLVYFS